ncbi:Opacity-associated protein OapB [Rodentibacter caecimuris]|uniref:Opacity-associated protein OapB n=1 Tax=Rodentibacter caecimuris TaxID=1796644 RepID=A0A1V3KLJ0_9PAST|nr:MliC family protein [Rodentibacter heylii]OOF78531.1 Opacity-associated protein OapB [Rodentibacter heylii]
MLKKISFILTALLLNGCAENTLLSEPLPQKMKVQRVDKTSQIGSAKLYLCKDNKVVRVTHSTEKKNKKTLKRVTITFNNMTEKLMLVISERGKDYGNIRWTWQERDDLSLLKTSVGKILAEQCRLRSSELLPSE